MIKWLVDSPPVELKWFVYVPYEKLNMLLAEFGY
jgi:hypothetical protein